MELKLQVLLSDENQIILHESEQNITFLLDPKTFFQKNPVGTIVGVAFQPEQANKVITIKQNMVLHTLLLENIPNPSVLT